MNEGWADSTTGDDVPLDPARVVPYRRWSDPAVDNDMRLQPTPLAADEANSSMSLWTAGLLTKSTPTSSWLAGLVKEEARSHWLEGLVQDEAPSKPSGPRSWFSSLDDAPEPRPVSASSGPWLAGLVKDEKRPAFQDIARLLFGGSAEAPNLSSQDPMPGSEAAAPSEPAPFTSSSAVPAEPAEPAEPAKPAAPGGAVGMPSITPLLGDSAPAPSERETPVLLPRGLEDLPAPVTEPPRAFTPPPIASPPVASPPIASPPVASPPMAPPPVASPPIASPPVASRPMASPPVAPPPAAPPPVVPAVAPRAEPSEPAMRPSVVAPKPRPPKKTVTLARPGQRIPGRDKVSFYRSLAAMFESGVPLFAIFEFLSREGENKNVSLACRRMGQSLVSGMPLSAAAMQEPALFDVKAVRMLDVGYRGGQMSEILGQLAQDEEHAWKMSQMLKSQLTYPCGIALMTLLAVLVLPPLVLTELLEQVVSLTANPPALSLWLLRVSAILGSPPTIGAALLSLAGATLWLRSARGRAFLQNAELAVWFLPALAPLWRSIVGVRFLRVFSMTYRAGLPATLGMELASSATGSQLSFRVFPLMKKTLLEGGTLAESFAAGGFLPGLAIEAIQAGEAAGKVPLMLDNSAMILEAEVQNRIDTVAKLIEPIVLACLGVFVGVFVLGCLLPIVELTSTL